MLTVVREHVVAVLVLGLTMACGGALCEDQLPSATIQLCPGLPSGWRLDVEAGAGTWDGNVTLTDTPPVTREWHWWPLPPRCDVTVDPSSVRLVSPVFSIPSTTEFVEISYAREFLECRLYGLPVHLEYGLARCDGGVVQSGSEVVIADEPDTVGDRGYRSSGVLIDRGSLGAKSLLGSDAVAFVRLRNPGAIFINGPFDPCYAKLKYRDVWGGWLSPVNVYAYPRLELRLSTGGVLPIDTQNEVKLSVRPYVDPAFPRVGAAPVSARLFGLAADHYRGYWTYQGIRYDLGAPPALPVRAWVDLCLEFDSSVSAGEYGLTLYSDWLEVEGWSPHAETSLTIIRTDSDLVYGSLLRCARPWYIPIGPTTQLEVQLSPIYHGANGVVVGSVNKWGDSSLTKTYYQSTTLDSLSIPSPGKARVTGTMVARSKTTGQQTGGPWPFALEVEDHLLQDSAHLVLQKSPVYDQAFKLLRAQVGLKILGGEGDIIIAVHPDAMPRVPNVAWLDYSEGTAGGVYVANVDGTNRVSVSNDSAGKSWVCLSADGTKVAWLSDRDGDWDIWVANTDGSGLFNVTATMGGAQGDWVSISGDGSKVAWMSTRDGYPDGHDQVYVANTNGTGLTNVSADSHSWNDYPSISADGSKVAWVSDRDGEWDVWVANTDGSGLTNVSGGLGWVYDNQPSLSADGAKVAWVHDPFGLYPAILVANTDGTGIVQVATHVTDDNDYDGGPSLSADGTKVAWESNVDGNPEVYVANADGTNPVNVSRDGAEDWDPSLNSDGSKVAWRSNRDGDWDVYVANTDGTGRVNVSNNIADDWFPSLQGN
jgi:TolB protein